MAMDEKTHAAITSSGDLCYYLDDAPQIGWLSVRIEELRIIKSAVNATVEVKSGGFLRQARLCRRAAELFALDGQADC